MRCDRTRTDRWIFEQASKIAFWVFIHTLMHAPIASSDTLQVPNDYATIEEAIHGSRPGDTILVGPGVYRLHSGRITIVRKFFTLKSTHGAAKTIIEGWGNNPVVTFTEGSRAVIDGFTITSINDEDSLPLRGGGIYCVYSSSPTIINNIITGNNAVFGGGIYCDEETSPTIIDNSIIKNNAERFGGGIFSHKASPRIVRNRIVANAANASGGGIFCDRASPHMTNNVIWKNRARFGGGISSDKSFSTINNNTITENEAASGGGIFFEGGTTRIVNVILWNNKDDLYSRTFSPSSRPGYSNIKDGDFRGLNGNISADPLFMDPENGDFHLRQKSPCINAGNPDSTYNDPDGSINDMGAYGGPKAYLRGEEL